MPTQIGIRELRLNLSRAIEQVRRGETVEVTKDGEPVARIVPITYRTMLDQLIAEGKVRPALRPMDLTRALRRATTGITASEALQQDRGE